jgi:predicted dienelactone hydrolase
MEPDADAGPIARPDGAMDGGSTDGGPMPPVEEEPPYGGASSYTVSMPGSDDQADIYYPSPAEPSRMGLDAFPAVVFMQGANVSRVHYSGVATRIARYGFVLIVADQQRTTILGSGLFPTVELVDRSLAVLEQENGASGSPVNGIVDTSRTGVLGHSLGGAAGLEAIDGECSSFLCEGSSYERPESLKAGVFYGTNRESPLGGSIPETDNDGVAVMLIQGSNDGLASPEAGRETYDNLSSAPKAYALLEGANHYNVTDTQNPEGARADPNESMLPQEQGIRRIGTLAGIYLTAHVLDRQAARDRVYGDMPPFSDVLEAVEPPRDSEGDGGPAQAGPCNHARTETSTTRSVDGSDLPLQVYRPTDASGETPVVVFSPGTQLGSGEYEDTLEHIASWCYGVVASGRSYSPLAGDSDEEWTSDIRDMVAFANSDNAPEVFDSDEIALIGHSAGAKNSFRALTSDPELAETIVAWDVAGQNPPLDGLSDMQIPVFLQGELHNSTSTFGMACAPADQNFQTYYDALPEDLPTLSVEFENADHLAWLDSRDCGLPCTLCSTNDSFDRDVFERRMQGFTVAWLETMLRGNSDFETYLFGPEMDAEVDEGGLVVQQK